MQIISLIACDTDVDSGSLKSLLHLEGDDLD